VPLLTLIILGFLAGSLIKLADDIADRNFYRSFFAIPFGLSYGFLMGYLMISDTGAALLFGGIVLGNLITGKINSTGHYFGLASILAVVFLYGIKLSFLVLPVAVLAALDESEDVIRVSRLKAIFEYRLFLKLGILLLVIMNMLGLSALLLLLAFDSAYIITERINLRLNNEI